MKKLLSIALCAAVASAFAAGETPAAAELGTVGVTAITTSLSNAIVAVSYDDLAGGEGMVYSNLVKTANLEENDKLVEFRDGKYTGWVLKENAQGVKCWEGMQGVLADSSGKQIDLATSASDAVTNVVGTGIWLVRQNPTDDKNKAKPFYIYGKPSSKTTVELVAKKWNLVGNPTQGEAQVGFVGTISDGDMIVIPIEPAGALCRYTYHKGMTVETTDWRKVNSENKWVYGLPNIHPGLGFWIQTKEAVSLTWTGVSGN